jgi:hypothetical protein
MSQHYDLDDHHEYPRREAEFRNSIRALEGRTLREVVLQIIEPEINMVFLRFEEAWYAVVGQLGSELLQVYRHDGEPPDDLGPSAWYERFDAAALFHGRMVQQARAIGAAWNGHGIEISFAGVLDRTLIIQSIYAGAVPTGFVDSLRVGIASYVHGPTHPNPEQGNI